MNIVLFSTLLRVSLAAAAVETRRIRLGTLITPVPRRRPQVLAVQCSTSSRNLGSRSHTSSVLMGTAPQARKALGR